MNRIEALRQSIEVVLTNMTDAASRRCAYCHLYGVSYTAALIALKRGEDVELATMAGMLHDIASFKLKGVTSANHAEKSAVIAREMLDELNLTSPQETDVICTAIHKHSDKEVIDSPFDEVLKDADVFAHGLYNIPSHNFRTYRWKDLCREFNIPNMLD